MKINFLGSSIERILTGKKTITWRVGKKYEKLNPGEKLVFYANGKKFAKAKVLWIKKTTFENLTEEDKEGHKVYKNIEEMCKTFSSYYKKKVTPKTKLFIIKFKILK
ncbi:MAG: ASCH domain-containing protein [Candidatus Pacearchaeota archaeon]